MTLWIVLIVIVVLVIAYVLEGRTWLKKQPWAVSFFAWIEPIELYLWSKSETILWSRFLVIAGAVPVLLEELEKLNVPGITDILPDQIRGWWTLTFCVVGIVNEILRRYTTKPLEIVATPNDAPAAVKEAVAAVEIMNAEAVAVVKVAAAEEKVAKAEAIVAAVNVAADVAVSEAKADAAAKTDNKDSK